MRDYLNMFGKTAKFGIIVGILAVLVAGIVVMVNDLILGIVIIVVGVGIEVVVFKIFLGPNVRQRRLLATGEEAKARILEIADTGVTVNMNPMVKFLLEVQPAEGEPYQAQVKSIISRLEVPQFQPGVLVPVVFNPKNRTEVAIGTKEKVAGEQASGGRGALVGQPDAGKNKEVGDTLQAMEQANEKILAAGQEAPAKVVLSTWMGVYVNGNNPLTHFMLEVMPPGREVFQAEATAIVAEASVLRYEPGQTITVKFDPEDLTRVAILHS